MSVRRYPFYGLLGIGTGVHGVYPAFLLAESTQKLGPQTCTSQHQVPELEMQTDHKCMYTSLKAKMVLILASFEPHVCLRTNAHQFRFGKLYAPVPKYFSGHLEAGVAWQDTTTKIFASGTLESICSIRAKPTPAHRS